MKKSIVELMDEFMKTATPESFLRDCKEFGIELEDIAPLIDKNYESKDVVQYTQQKTAAFLSEQDQNCTAA